MLVTYKLIKNDFINSGICVYEDSCGNKLQVFRKLPKDKYTDGFSAKLRFSNKNVRSDALRVEIPLPSDCNGQNISLNFLDGKDHSEDIDVKCGVDMLTKITERWIMMLNDIAMLDMPAQYTGKSEEDLAKDKVDVLTDYPELRDFLATMMQ